MKGLALRTATADDVDLYYRWAVDPDVRRQSFSSGDIPYDDHVAWFRRRLADPDSVLFVLVEGDTPVGQIRFTINRDRDAEIGYSVAREARGRGLARVLVEMGVAAMAGRGIKTIVARVKPENLASVAVFRRCGFEEDASGDPLVFRKRLTGGA
jgi:RimJ/RimL family protein N-acetyltransferase